MLNYLKPNYLATKYTTLPPFTEHTQLPVHTIPL